MTSEAKKRANAKYDAAHTRQIMFKFNKTTDADVLAKLDSVGNKQGYVKDLIRGDILAEKDLLVTRQNSENREAR